MHKIFRYGSSKQDMVKKKSTQNAGFKQTVIRSLSALFFAAIVAGGYMLLNSSLFTISKIKTYNVHFVDESEVNDILSACLGCNIWKIDIDSVAVKIEDLPWVKGVRIGRRLPSALNVNVEEWEPAILMSTGENIMGLIENGNFQKINKTEQVLELPMFINKLKPSNLPTETECALLQKLIWSIDSIDFEKKFPVDFMILSEDGFSIVLQGSRNTLLLGDAEFDYKLKRYLMVTHEVTDNSIVDLRFDQQVYISDGS
jgi:hypothetical protein